MTKPYRLVKGRISRPEPGGRKFYEPGDIVKMTEEQLAGFTGVLEPVHGAPPPQAKGDEKKKEKPALAADLITEIMASESATDVELFLTAEAAGPNRVSVIEAANARLDELTKENVKEK